MIDENGIERSWRKHRIRIGDFVEDALKPIVEVIDDTLGTNLKGCGGCQQRKQWLNNLTKEKDDSFGKEDNT